MNRAALYVVPGPQVAPARPPRVVRAPEGAAGELRAIANRIRSLSVSIDGQTTEAAIATAKAHAAELAGRLITLRRSL